MKAWAKSFYLSAAWEKTRAAYLMSQDYICERCGQPAKIVHHKRWLNRENINDINLTSQLFANIYLDALDQFIKHELGVEAYIRYMDDFVILSPDKEQLRSWLARIEQFLREELKLEFNPKTTILAAKNGIDFVGYKHRATHRKVRKDSIKRIKRTIKKCESGKITKEQLQKSIQSWTGHAGHADSYNLRKKIETLAEAAIEKAA